MKMLFLAAIFSVAMLSVKAQTIPERPRDTTRPASGQMDAMKKHKDQLQALNLTADQREKLKAFRETEKAKRDEIMALPEDQRAAKLAELRKSHRDQMQSILTPEQQAQMKEHLKKSMAGNPRVNEAASNPAKTEVMKPKREEKLKTALGLNDDQVQQMQANRAATAEKMKSVRNDATLTDDQKKEKMKSLIREQHDNLKKILTPEQMEKMKGMKKHKHKADTDPAKPATI